MNGRILGLILTCSIGSAHAQLNQLTLREAESLVELVPDVSASMKRGECPQISPGYADGFQLEFRVRTTCGSGSGMLIGAYTVNRRTGSVESWGDNPHSVADSRGETVASSLISEARRRILSASEARCLAGTAAGSLPGWDAADATISVQPFSEAGSPSAREEARENLMRFSATRVSRSIETRRILTVNLAGAVVRDEETGKSLMSASVGSLTAALLALRAPVSLTDEEAALIAAATPPISNQLKDTCRLVTGGAFYSRSALVSLSCKASLATNSSVLVNLETGMLTDAATGTSLDSSGSLQLAASLLSDAKKRRVESQKIVEEACTAH